VEQPADGRDLAQLVEALHRLFGLQHAHFDALVPEPGKRLGLDLEALPDSLRQHHRGGAVGDQLLHVGRLNAGHVPGAGLAPIPRAGAAGIDLGVLEDADALDLDPAPSQVGNGRRLRGRVGRRVYGCLLTERD